MGDLMKYKSCYIFCAGDLYAEFVDIPKDALVIAADGGLYHTEALGIRPDVILGDFDSHPKPDSDCIIYPTEKDFTDSFIAVKYAYDMGISDIFVYGALGGKRLEHTIANLQMCEYYTRLGCKIILFGDNQMVYTYHSDGELVKIMLDEKNSGYVSIFAVGGSVEGVSIKGLKYSLENSVLSSSFPLGVSNEYIGKKPEISFTKGTIMVISCI